MLSGALRRNGSEPGSGFGAMTALRTQRGRRTGSPLGGGRAGEAGGDDLSGMAGRMITREAGETGAERASAEADDNRGAAELLAGRLLHFIAEGMTRASTRLRCLRLRFRFERLGWRRQKHLISIPGLYERSAGGTTRLSGANSGRGALKLRGAWPCPEPVRDGRRFLIIFSSFIQRH